MDRSTLQRYREATNHDIPQMTSVRFSVKENVLSNKSLVTEKDYEEYVNLRGKGWVSEHNGLITGFAIADLQDHNIWALFVRPEYEHLGIGKTLHEMMLSWYFSQTQQKVWLGTAPNSRADSFYRKAGWKEVGMHGKEIKFEMTYEDWLQRR